VLPRHDDVAPGFVSRDYRIERASLDDVPVLSLVGGKWTTFRALSEHISTDVMQLLGRPRTVSTTDLAIGGGAGYPRTDAGAGRSPPASSRARARGGAA
jgi:glycerol-3-phosphate dehydrogenase